MKALSYLRNSPVLQRFTSLAVFCLVFIILPTACNSLVQEVQSPEYTGKEIFMGVLMNRGPVAQLVPTATSQMPDLQEVIKDAEKIKAVLIVEDHLIAQIEKDFPTFFQDFKGSIESGDHMRVKKALKQALGVMAKSFYHLPEYKANKESLIKSRKVLSNIDYTRFVDKNGKVDAKALQAHVENQFESSTSKDDCITVTIIFVAAVAVLVAFVIGIETAMVVTTALGIELAIVQDIAYAGDVTVTFADDKAGGGVEIGYAYGGDYAGGYAYAGDYAASDTYNSDMEISYDADHGGGEGYSVKASDLRSEMIIDEIVKNLRKRPALSSTY